MDKNKYIPLICVWELTLKCNMNCIHCGSQAGQKRENELSVKEALVIADELIMLGCKEISFIGGEVFLYDRWETIARKLSDNGISVNIITNGFFFGDKQLQEVQYAHVTNIALSIDGMENNHNKIRNNSKSFKHLTQTIDRLNKENISIGVNTTLMNNNFEDVEELYHFNIENNIKMWQLQLANPMGNWQTHKEHQLGTTQIRELTRFIKQKRDENKIKIYTGDNIGYYDDNEKYIRGLPGDTNYWSGCQAGLTVVGIDSIGNVKGCESLYDDLFIEGNLRKETLSEIWFNKDNFAYNRKFTPDMLSGKCSKCEMGVFCRAGCRGACYFNNGKLFENAYCVKDSL
jgi:radical SAM protein with 4Fe4S-binding SPASM domain